MTESVKPLEKRIGEKVTIEILTPHEIYTGVLVRYDGEHYIFEEDHRERYISKHHIRFPN
ncbi:hypothetical protein J4442_02940 [Candidatus Woesearchaeota archaeon]|nr:hypothetical protein [Candidatus Woesearchaeota archaeon]